MIKCQRKVLTEIALQSSLCVFLTVDRCHTADVMFFKNAESPFKCRLIMCCNIFFPISAIKGPSPTEQTYQARCGNGRKVHVAWVHTLESL